MINNDVTICNDITNAVKINDICDWICENRPYIGTTIEIHFMA